MATQVPFIFRASPLPENFVSDPQGFLDAMVARLSAESEVEIAVFVSGAVEPSSNVGPWLKDGTEWWVWDVGLGQYIPQVVPPASLGYIASAAAPDETIYTFWIELNGSGKAIAIKYYSGGAWKDVYEDKFATYSTTAQMNAAIAAAVSAATFRGYPAQASNTTPQNIAVDESAYKLTFDVAPINSGSPFNTSSSRYIAPVAGFYQVSMESQFDNIDGDATGMTICLKLYKNGAEVLESCAAVASPPGNRWFPDLSGELVSMNVSDYLEVFAACADGTNTGDVQLSTGRLNVVRIAA